MSVTVSPAEEITAFEIVFVASGAKDGSVSVTFPLGGVPTDWYTYMDNTSRLHDPGEDTVRMAAVRLDPGLATMAVGTHDVATLTFTTDSVCTGTIDVVGGEWTDYANPVGTIETQFTDVDANILSVAVEAGEIEIVNVAPTIDPIPAQTMHWGEYLTPTVTAVGHDDDPGCEHLWYKLDLAPAGMEIDSVTGAITYFAPADAVCYLLVSRFV
jgi:hypothetical protein